MLRTLPEPVGYARTLRTELGLHEKHAPAALASALLKHNEGKLRAVSYRKGQWSYSWDEQGCMTLVVPSDEKPTLKLLMIVGACGLVALPSVAGSVDHEELTDWTLRFSQAFLTGGASPTDA